MKNVCNAIASNRNGLKDTIILLNNKCLIVFFPFVRIRENLTTICSSQQPILKIYNMYLNLFLFAHTQNDYYNSFNININGVAEAECWWEWRNCSLALKTARVCFKIYIDVYIWLHYAVVLRRRRFCFTFFSRFSSLLVARRLQMAKPATHKTALSQQPPHRASFRFGVCLF